MKTTEHMTKLFKALYDYGYRYLARDPEDKSLYAYKDKPHLEDGCYVLSDEQMERGYCCLLLTEGGIRMFLDDHDISELDDADLTELSRMPIDAEAEPVELAALL